MALVRIVSSFDTLPFLCRISYAANSTATHRDDGPYPGMVRKHVGMLHMTSPRCYPDIPYLPLPTNMSEIFANETGRFAPERSRDIGAPSYLHSVNHYPKAAHSQSSFSATSGDTHVDSYDCFGAVSLNGSMQSNVPKPYCSYGKSTYLNMPGGAWARDDKYIAEHMQKSHCRSLPFITPGGRARTNGNGCRFSRDRLLPNASQPSHCISRASYSVFSQANEGDNVKNTQDKKLSRGEVIKKYCKEYGKTFVVIHIGVSLMSLGGFYVAVSSGADLTQFTNYWMDAMSVEGEYRDLIRTSTDFALAYMIHKLMFPVRLFITLSITPLITTHRVWRPPVFDPLVNPPVHPKLKKLKEIQANGPAAIKDTSKNVSDAPVAEAKNKQ